VDRLGELKAWLANTPTTIQCPAQLLATLRPTRLFLATRGYMQNFRQAA
jgi:hypothetical protein